MPTFTTSYPSGRNPSVSSTGWEEPHPGHKFSIPVKSGGKRQSDQDGTGDNGGVKGDTVGTHESPTTQDLNILSPTASVSTSMSSTRYAEPIGMPLGPSISPDSRSIGSRAISEAHSLALTTHTLPVDVDMDRYNKMDMDKSNTTTQVISPAPSNFSDVSNYLDYASTPEDMSGVVSIYPESFDRMAPNEDLYGWDAEWDCKLTTPSPPPPATLADRHMIDRHYIGPSAPYQRRRRAKNNLLGRVFSVGKTPPRHAHHRDR